MLQSAYAQKPVGLNLNFAIAKVWGQGEEGPPGLVLRFPFSLIMQSHAGKFKLVHNYAANSKLPVKDYIVAKTTNRSRTCDAVRNKRNYSLPCTRKPLQQCRSTFLKSIFESPMIHARGINIQLIAKK
ncbi:MAG: hypothetical protein ACOH5I_12305 [Oligoflexus sp.]